MKNIALFAGIVLTLGTVAGSGQSGKPRLERREVESMLGKRCESMIPPEGSFCYKASAGSAIVEYDGEERVKTLKLFFDCAGPFEKLDVVASKLVPANLRGEHKRGPGEVPRERTTGEMIPLSGCAQIRTEEYENLVMVYSYDNCTNCPHPSITITWRQ